MALPIKRRSKIMKKIISLSSVLLFLLFSGISAYAADTSIDCSLTIPAQNQIGKSVHAKVKLGASQPCHLGAILLTIQFDSNFLTFKEATLIDGGNATIDTYADGNTVKILFLNTSGSLLSPSPNEIIQIRFMALAQQGNTSINIMGKQAVTQDEQHLMVKDSMEYSIALQEKEVTSTQNASGRRVAQSTSSSSKSNKSSSSSHGRNTNNNEEENADENYDENTPNESLIKNTKDSMNLGKVGSWFENNITLFIWGIAFAIGLAILLFLVYKIGKKQLKTENLDTLPEKEKDSDKNEKKDKEIDVSPEKEKEKENSTSSLTKNE